VKPDWRLAECGSCRGYGLVSNCSTGEPQDCRTCEGTGRVWIRPTGHVFQWPGGPALGRWYTEDYDHAIPVEVQP
jgi:hypothetical protein